MITKESTSPQNIAGDTKSPSKNPPTYIYSKELKEKIPIPDDLYALMDEVAAAAFLNLTRRGLQNFRLTGEGPQFIRISSRCIKYRKVDLISFQESKLRKSTSDIGKKASTYKMGKEVRVWE